VWIQRETIPKFLLTATLPTHLEPMIQTWFAPADNPIPLFRWSTERPNLSYNVRHHLDMDIAVEVIAIRALEKELPKGKKMLVFGGLTSHIDELAQALNAPRYYHKW
jgi:superfamily II DNA helicase RecQ